MLRRSGYGRGRAFPGRKSELHSPSAHITPHIYQDTGAASSGLFTLKTTIQVFFPALPYTFA
jgi:hypothetical protein